MSTEREKLGVNAEQFMKGLAEVLSALGYSLDPDAPKRIAVALQGYAIKMPVR